MDTHTHTHTTKTFRFLMKSFYLYILRAEFTLWFVWMPSSWLHSSLLTLIYSTSWQSTVVTFLSVESASLLQCAELFPLKVICWKQMTVFHFVYLFVICSLLQGSFPARCCHSLPTQFTWPSLAAAFSNKVSPVKALLRVKQTAPLSHAIFQLICWHKNRT